MMKRYYLPLLLLVGIHCGCEKENAPEYTAPSDQPVLFEYRYVNHAWGYSEHGWLIDSSGDVLAYDLPEDYRLPDSTGYLTHEDLVHNLSQSDSLIHRIGKEDLKYYTGLISGAAEGKTGDAKNIAFDAGSSVLSCYLYDADKDMYRYVFLAGSGDWQQSNEAPEAKILVDWMRGMGVFWLAN